MLLVLCSWKIIYPVHDTLATPITFASAEPIITAYTNPVNNSAFSFRFMEIHLIYETGIIVLANADPTVTAYTNNVVSSILVASFMVFSPPILRNSFFFWMRFTTITSRRPMRMLIQQLKQTIL